MKTILILLLTLGTYLEVFCATDEQLKDVDILHKCLANAHNRNAATQLHKVTQYSKWQVEEIPCFTRCISSEKGWFNIDESKWNKQQIVDDLGEDMYNYCRYELDRPFGNACDYAYKGLKCLKQAEVYTSLTYANALSCTNQLNASMESLQKYTLFPAQEEVPCLFKCFAEKMNFYTADYAWNFDAWVKAFGPMKHEEDYSAACKTSAEAMKERDKCAWMYEEYICLERLNYNSDGSMVSFPNLTTVKSVVAENETVTEASVVASTTEST